MVAANALYGYFGHGLVYLPDFGLYTAGGVGLFPSVPGRLLGSLGPTVFALISALGAGTVVYLVGHHSGRRVGLAVLLSPFALVLGYAGIDPIALALFTLGAVGYRPLLFLPLSAVTHLALVPFVALEVYRCRPNPAALFGFAFFLGIPMFFALALTPYSGILTIWADPITLGYFALGTVLAVAFAGPLWLVVPRQWSSLVPFLTSGALIGVQQHVQARYMLPAVVLLALDPIRAALPARSAEAAPLLVRPALETPGVFPYTDEGPALRRSSVDVQAIPAPDVLPAS